MNTNTNATLRVKITMANGDIWFATAPPAHGTLIQRIARLNKLAKIKRNGATYEYASESEYASYRAQTQTLIKMGTTPTPPSEITTISQVKELLTRY